MGALPVIRQELLAQNLARGMDFPLAAQKAGFVKKVGFAQPKIPVDVMVAVNKRVDEILESALTDTVMEAREILGRLSGMARADIREFVGYDDELDQWKILPIERWTNDISSRVIGFKLDKQGKPEVKLESSLKALEMLGRARGIFNERVEVAVSTRNIEPTMSAEQAAELYALMLGVK